MFSNLSPNLIPRRNIVSGGTRFKIHDPKYDNTFKILLGERGAEPRAISFLNAVLDLDGDKVESVKFVPESLKSVDGLTRAVANDIKIEGFCKTTRGKRFIVEIQRKRVAGDSNRWVYYGSQEIVEQGRAYYSSLPDVAKYPKERKTALAKFYKELYPVNMIAVMDFDTPLSRNELQNDPSDVLVHWNICECSTKKIANNLISWTFVILPRFLQLLSTRKANDFRGDILSAWLYLLTRSENSEIDTSSSITAGDPAIEAGIRRLANLSEDEKRALAAEQEKEIIDLGSQQAEIEDSFHEGLTKGLKDGLTKGLTKGLKDGLTKGHKEKVDIAKNIMKSMPDFDDAKISELTYLSIDEIQAIRRG